MFTDKVFGRINNDGNVQVLYKNDGDFVTTLDADNLYPVDSNLSTKWDHPRGIILSPEDAKRILLGIEDA